MWVIHPVKSNGGSTIFVDSTLLVLDILYPIKLANEKTSVQSTI
jgi:hypothetical protein